jgi:hypothetical protein
MAQQAAFEEKEYEQPLNIELLFDSQNLLWSPGQVFEKHFGIDAAIYSGNPRFWRLFGYPNVPDGVTLNHFRWQYIWRKKTKKRQLPTFKTNLLLQTKRPEHRAGNNASYSKHGISGSYWQFQLTKHQQEALEKLHKTLKNRALICYASAAFHLLEDLFKHIENQELVDNSTFVQINRLANHEKWVYNQSGTKGIACSEIEDISDKPFRELIATASKNNNGDENALSNLIFLENASLAAIEEWF